MLPKKLELGVHQFIAPRWILAGNYFFAQNSFPGSVKKFVAPEACRNGGRLFAQFLKNPVEAVLYLRQSQAGVQAQLANHSHT